MEKNPKNKCFTSDLFELDFKEFEEEIMKKADLIGHNYLKDMFYKI